VLRCIIKNQNTLRKGERWKAANITDIIFCLND